MPVYIGDELARTSHFTAEEFGAYISLVMHYWQHGSLPIEDTRLARIARASLERWPTIRENVAPLFGSDWRLTRLEEQRAEAEKTHLRRSEAGKRGGRPRRDEKPGDMPGNKPGLSQEKAGQYAGPKQPQPHSRSIHEKGDLTRTHARETERPQPNWADGIETFSQVGERHERERISNSYSRRKDGE
jgi:uncharacterized protein YdaU (DUF1376 family)